MAFKFSERVAKFDMPASWHFVIVPENIMKKVKASKNLKTIGYGFYPINVKVGKTKWKTSILPLGEKNGIKRYFIAIKALVRKNEVIEHGDTISLSFEL